MNLLRSFPAMAFALVLLSIVGVCAAQRDAGMLLIAGTVAALSWMLTEGPRGYTVPRWVSNLLVIVVTLNVIRDLMVNREDVLGVLGRFAVWLTLIKLYERRSVRDYAHLLTLSLLLMMTGCLQSTDLLFGIILLLYAAMGLYVLLLYQLHMSFEQLRDERRALAPARARMAPPLKPIIGRSAGLHFRGVALGIAACGVALSVLAFITFPRDFGADMFGTLRSPVAMRVSRFAWEIDLSRGGWINQSRVKVGSVQLLNEKGDPIALDEPLLLRGEVLDQYEGAGRWTAAPGREGEVEVSPAVFTPLVGGPRSGAALTQRVTLNRPASGRTPLFTLGAPLAVSGDVSDGRLVFDPIRRTLRTFDDARRMLTYSVKVWPQSAGAVPRVAGAEGRWAGLSSRHFEDRDGSVRSLGLQLLREAGISTERPDTPPARFAWYRAAAETFTRYLQGPRFAYTTDLSSIVRRYESDDPITMFLTQTRRGHCEYFASGLVAMCHAVGVPARVVVGYVAFEYDYTVGEYPILESNAHAWAEVRTGEGPWTTFDPTPQATLREIHQDRGTIGDDLRSVYEDLEGGWTTGVVGFDSATQDRLGERLNQGWGQWVLGLVDAARQWMADVNAFFNVGPGGYIWMGIVALALVIAVVALMKLMHRNRDIRRTIHLEHVRGAEHQRLLRHLGFYVDLLDVLRRGGMPKPAWQPPGSFAAGLELARPDIAAPVRELTDLFYAARYGGIELDRAARERAATRVRQVAERLRTRI